MSSAPTTAEIARDARWLAQALDPPSGNARLIAMDRAAYRDASFLDDRMLQQPRDAQLVPWTTLEDAAALSDGEDAGWIFHIGHVGSTLIARMLGEFDGLLSVREPRILRDLTTVEESQRPPYAAVIRRLLSRSFADDERAVVKATSFVSEIAPELMLATGAALFMYARPEAYIASILAGENSLRESRMLAASRAERAQGRVGAIAANSDAELAAAAWACEMTGLEQAAERLSDARIRWMDFDRALDDMASALDAAATLFDVKAAAAKISDIASGPLLSRYSKATEYEYSPKLRRDLIAEATAQHGPAIRAAIAMLENAAGPSPLLQRALERAQAEG